MLSLALPVYGSYAVLGSTQCTVAMLSLAVPQYTVAMQSVAVPVYGSYAVLGSTTVYSS